LNYVWTELTPDGATTDVVFKDEANIYDWAYDYVYKMRDLGIVKGDTAGNFNPKSSTNRAEMATITVRLGDAIDRYEPTPSIAVTALTSYSLYSDKLNASELADVAAVIKAKTGVELASVSVKPASNYINFTVDESLKMLQYTITEENNVLTFKVSSEYAVAYFADIVADALAKRDDFTVPAGFKGEGYYTLDEATNKSEINFKCETDKNPLAYELGDDVTFRISLIQDGKLVSVPQFAYTYDPDYGTEVTELVPGYTGQFIITMDGLDKPGSAFLKVHLANRRGVKIASLDAEMVASVIFDFYNVEVSTEKPADFDSFWDGKVAELMTVEPEAISCVPCPYAYYSNTHDTYCVEVQSLGTVAYGHVTVPKNASPGSLEIRVNYTAYGAVGSDMPIYGSCIYVSVNRHEIKNHLPDADYVEYENAIGKWGFDNPNREDSYFMGALLRDVQILRYAETTFADLWNGKDIILHGGSFGGFQSIAVAGLYDKVSYIELSYPWMSDLGGADNDRHRATFMPDYTEGSKYFDSCYFAERYDGNVYMYIGLGDEVCPSYGLVSAYNVFSGNKSFRADQCAGHGPSGGPYNKVYYLSSDSPAIDPMAVEIKDNGCAVSAPN
ncbi:MAG: acetylxylan esterase, partial [Clostridia bacterium]|nr:acetylxylan esterase [Clostridia bacterium]